MRRDDRAGRGGPPGGGAISGPMPSSGGRRRKGKRGQVDQEAVSANIFRTMKQMTGGPAKRRRPDEVDREELEAIRAAAMAWVASPKMKTRLLVRYVESTECEYQGSRVAADASTGSGSTPASAATSLTKSRVATLPRRSTKYATTW